MKKRSDRHNPEQKTGADIEIGKDMSPVELAKHRNLEKGGQPIKSKQRTE